MTRLFHIGCFGRAVPEPHCSAAFARLACHRDIESAEGFLTADYADLPDVFIRAHPRHPWSIWIRSGIADRRWWFGRFGPEKI